VATRPFCVPLTPNSPGAHARRSPSPVATFRYQTRRGDALRYFEVKDEDALVLGDEDEILASTTYSRSPVSLKLPLDTWQLSSSKIAVNGSAASILELSTDAAFPLEAGDAAHVIVFFDAPVFVDEDAAHTLKLSVVVESAFGIALPAACTRVCSYVKGNGTDAIYFNFSAVEGDSALAVRADYDALATSGWVRRRALPVATQSVSLTVPDYKAWRVSLSVDGTKPAKVASVFSADPVEALYEPQTLGSGDLLMIAVRFNKKVKFGRADGSPIEPTVERFGDQSDWLKLRLRTGRLLNGTTWINNTYFENGTLAQPYAWYVGGSGTATLLFKYIIQKEDSWADGYLNYASMHALEIGNEGIVLDTDAVSGYGPADMRLAPSANDARALNVSSMLLIDTVSTPQIIDAYGSSALVDPLIESDDEAFLNASIKAEFYRRASIDGLRGPIRMYDKKWKELNYEPVTYTVGDVIRLEVDFTAGVTFLSEDSPPPRLYLDGLIGRYRDLQELFPENFTYAKYVSGNGTRFLRFEWEVPDEDPFVDAPTPSTGVGRLAYRGVRALVDSGVKLRRAAFGDASLGTPLIQNPELGLLSMYLPPSEFSPLEHYYEIKVDGSKPRIIDMKLSQHSSTVRDAGLAVGVDAFSLGDTIDITVVFSAGVVVEGVPTILLNSRGGEPSSSGKNLAYAYYVSGSGTSELTFRYDVVNGDAVTALSHATTQHECFSGLVREQEGLPLTSGLNDTERLSLALTVRWPHGDRCPRTLTPSPTSPSLSILRMAETPTIQADLMLPMPGYHVYAYSQSQMGATTSLEASEVALAATSLEGDLVTVDTAAPVILHVTSPSKDDVYGDKAIITLWLTFSAPVVITGQGVIGELRLALTNREGIAYYARGNGSAVLEFDYFIEYGDTASPLDYAADAEKIKTLIFYETGIPETQEAKANENVQCALSNRTCEFVAEGGTIGNAGETSNTFYINQSESLIISNKIVPQYPAGVYRRLLAGADVAEARPSGVLANLQLPEPGPRKSIADVGSLIGQGRKIIVSAVALKVLEVFAVNGTYGVGAQIEIGVRFERPVNATGVSYLLLDVDGLDEPAKAVIDQTKPFELSEVLYYVYVVRAGDSSNRLGYVAHDSLDATEGAIVSVGGGCAITLQYCPHTQLAGVPAPTTLPEPGAPGSLSVTSSVIIKTGQTRVGALTLNETRRASYVYAPGASVPILLGLSNPVRRDMAAQAFRGALDISGFADTLGRRAVYSGGDTSNALGFSLRVPGGCSSSLLSHGGAEGALHLGGGALLARRVELGDGARRRAAPLSFINRCFVGAEHVHRQRAASRGGRARRVVVLELRGPDFSKERLGLLSGRVRPAGARFRPSTFSGYAARLRPVRFKRGVRGPGHGHARERAGRRAAGLLLPPVPGQRRSCEGVRGTRGGH
jgi:hypothetical protein